MIFISFFASLFTLPLGLYYFEILPSHSLLANVLVAFPFLFAFVGTVILILLGTLDFLTGIEFFDSFAHWLGDGLNNLLNFVKWLIRGVEAIPGSVIHIRVDVVQVILLYLTLFWCIFAWHRWRRVLHCYKNLCPMVRYAHEECLSCENLSCENLSCEKKKIYLYLWLGLFTAGIFLVYGILR
ncbi:MAG: ComEC/Rec2 family competence protein [Cytophagales bacterium]|nr:ComEC/Rec2 family competence protein [Cytophagales bacterium]